MQVATGPFLGRRGPIAAYARWIGDPSLLRGSGQRVRIMATAEEGVGCCRNRHGERPPSGARSIVRAMGHCPSAGWNPPSGNLQKKTKTTACHRHRTAHRVAGWECATLRPCRRGPLDLSDKALSTHAVRVAWHTLLIRMEEGSQQANHHCRILRGGSQFGSSLACDPFSRLGIASPRLG